MERPQSGLPGSGNAAPERSGCGASDPLENRCKMRLVREPAGKADFGKRQDGCAEHLFGLLNPHAHDILMRSDMHCRFETLMKARPPHTGQRCQLTDVNIAGQMFSDIVINSPQLS